MQRETMENAYCTSDDASNSCGVSMDGQQTCNCASQTNHAKSAALLEKPFPIEEIRVVMRRSSTPLNTKQVPIEGRNNVGRLRNIRGGVILGVACITSPCCTPLIIPAVLGLLAGTPVALWLTQHAGLLYGGLTLVSAVSLVLGLRWVWQKLSLQTPPQPEAQQPKIGTEAQLYSASKQSADSQSRTIPGN